jgi:hypothetical protein
LPSTSDRDLPRCMPITTDPHQCIGPNRLETTLLLLLLRIHMVAWFARSTTLRGNTFLKHLSRDRRSRSPLLSILPASTMPYAHRGLRITSS